MNRMLGLLALYLAMATLAGCQQDAEQAADTGAATTASSTPATGTSEAGLSAQPQVVEDEFTQGQLASIREQLAAPSQPLVDFSYTPFGATEAVQVSSRIGKPLVVNFWAVWCPPCKMELPDFQEVYTQHNGEFALLGLCVDDKLDPEGFVKDNGYTWDFGYDVNGGEAYRITGIPRTLFVNRAGQVVIDISQAMSRPAFEAALDAILKG
jgi:thiol-disulfide isomerase/thioredoxin